MYRLTICSFTNTCLKNVNIIEWLCVCVCCSRTPQPLDLTVFETGYWSNRERWIKRHGNTVYTVWQGLRTMAVVINATHTIFLPQFPIFFLFVSYRVRSHSLKSFRKWDSDVSIRAGHASVTYFLYFDQWWISVLTAAHCVKKLLQWRQRAAPIYGEDK